MSVEAEQAFSTAGLIENKIRNRLGEAILDALIFPRSYFQKAID